MSDVETTELPVPLPVIQTWERLNDFSLPRNIAPSSNLTVRSSSKATYPSTAKRSPPY